MFKSSFKLSVESQHAVEWAAVVSTIFALTYICYSRVIDFNFLYWDTWHYILKNSCIQELSFSNLSCILTTPYFSNWHPVTSFTYALEYHFFGTNAGPYHISNLILHGLNGLLVYAIARKLFRRYGVAATQASIAAMLSAVLFIVHPQHVETVAWIADRKGLLSTAFLLISWIFYVEYVQRQSKRGSRFYFSLSLIAFAFALMSKPMAVTWPVLLLLLDVFPLKRVDFSSSFLRLAAQLKDLLVEKWLFFVLTAIMVSVTLYTQEEAMVELAAVSLAFRIINAMHSVFFYLGQWVLPLQLSPYYVFPEFLVNKDYITMVLLVCTFLVVTGVSVFLLFKRKPVFFVMWFFLLISLSPVLGIIQVGSQAAADRYTYFSLLPLHLLAGLGIVHCFSIMTNAMKLTVSGLVLSIVVFFISMTQSHSKLWENDLMLWGYVIEGGVGDNMLPLLAMAEALHREGDYGKALEYYIEADSMGKFPNPKLYVVFARLYSALHMDDYALQIYQFLQDDPSLDEDVVTLVTKDLKLMDTRKSASLAE